MDFAYETDTFANVGEGQGFTSPSFKIPNIQNLQAFQSFQASDISKKLGSLSLLNRKKHLEEDSENPILNVHEISVQRAKKSIQLLELSGCNFNNSLSSSSSLSKNDLSDGLYTEHEIMKKLSNIIESSSGYDSSLRQSLEILDERVNFELNNTNFEKHNNESSIKGQQYLQNISEKDQLGDMSRRYLRGLIEEDLIKEQATALRKFQKIVSSISVVQKDVEGVISKARSLDENVKFGIKTTISVKSQIDEIDKQRYIIDVKKDLLSAFKETFTLSQYDEHILHYGDLSNVSSANDVFNAIEHVKEIQQNCDILLGMENDTLGNIVLTNMSELLTTAKERILHYVQRNVEHIYSNSNVSQTFKKNIDYGTFQKSLVYIWNNDKDAFDSVVANLVEARSRTVLNEFMSQLLSFTNEANNSNISGSKLNQKSGRLFLSSYDTNRFVSDTLAYVHNVLVNEMEAARSLLTFEFTKEASIPEKELDNLVERIVQSIIFCLCKPLKGTIENSVRQESKVKILCQVSAVLDLYKSMYQKLLWEDTSAEELPSQVFSENDHGGNEETKTSLKSQNLISIIIQLENEIQEKAFSLVNLKLKNIKADYSDAKNFEEDSILPDWLVEWCQFIDQLFHEADPSGRKHILGFSDEQWSLFTSLLLKSPVEIVEQNAKHSKKSEKDEAAISEINCLDYIISRVSVIKGLNNIRDELQSLLEDKVNLLKAREFNKLLQNSGLFDIFNLINMIFELDDELFDVIYYQPIIENKLFNEKTFMLANQKLGEFLSNYIDSNILTKLMSPSLYNEVFEGSSIRFVKFYGKLLAITNEYLTNEKGEPYRVFQWDENGVATLMGIDDLN